MSALVSASFWYWYYVQTKSRAEAVALENLVRQHYHCLFPQIRRVNPATGSQPRKSLIAPLWNLEKPHLSGQSLRRATPNHWVRRTMDSRFRGNDEQKSSYSSFPLFPRYVFFSVDPTYKP